MAQQQEDSAQLLVREDGKGYDAVEVSPPSAPADGESNKQARLTAFIFQASWVVNIFLVFAKAYALVATNYSKAVAASLADSAVDVLSQGVLEVSQYFMLTPNKDYPVGRTRLEALGVIACSCIMSVASLAVLESACNDLYQGFAFGEFPDIEVNMALYGILGGGTLAKLILWNMCMLVTPRSDTLVALAEDHLNDVVSNVAAIATAMVAAKVNGAWWVDGVGALVISMWIISRWVSLTSEQVDKIIGKAAPDDFILLCEGIALEHHVALDVDCTRAYHWGARFMVEMEIILPADTPLITSHDIALDLQHKLEALPEVERAFVHVDYARREHPEHKVERTLLQIQEEKAPGSSGGFFGRMGMGAGGRSGGTSPRSNSPPPKQAFPV